MKLLRRWVIIREKDYNEKFLFRAEQVYDRVTWAPMSFYNLEQQNVVAILQNPHDDPPWKLSELQTMLWRYIEKCYNPRYPEWKLEQHNDELLICPDRNNARPSRLGIATVEKDL